MADSHSRSRSRSRGYRKHKKYARKLKRKRDRSRSWSSEASEVKRSRSSSKGHSGRHSHKSSPMLGDSALLEKILEAIHHQGRQIACLETEVRGHQPHSPAAQPQEEPTAPESRGTEPALSLDSVDHSVSFVTSDVDQGKEQSLVTQLFCSQQDSPSDLAWDQIMHDFAKTTVRAGLSDDLRTRLLSKYEVKEGFASFGPPKLNRLLLPVLKASSTVTKRDEYQVLAQVQVAAALNALGAGLSCLTRPEVASPLPAEGRAALCQIAEGLHLLADHQHRLSLARRAFIKPALNLLGKSTADLAPIDEWLFGTSFVEEVKDAQACEKVARVLAKAPPTAPRVAPQRTAKAQSSRKQVSSGNAKAPARQSSQPYRRAGALHSKIRPRRSVSRSRYHRR